MRPFLIGLVGAILGTIWILMAVHLYVDHQSLHALIGVENARQAQAGASGS